MSPFGSFVEVAIISPGVGICRSVVCGMYTLQFGIHQLGRGDFTLLLLAMENRKVQGFLLVENPDVSLLILAYSDLCVTERIGRPICLYLVDNVLVLQGEVLGEGP